MLGLIDRYKYAPRSLRDPLDAQVKRETGISLSEATNPDSPVGPQLPHWASFATCGRGIVPIDAVKQ